MLAVRMQRPEAGLLDPSRYGYTDEQVAEVVSTLSSLGFVDVETRRELGRQRFTAIVARR